MAKVIKKKKSPKQILAHSLLCLLSLYCSIWGGLLGRLALCVLQSPLSISHSFLHHFLIHPSQGFKVP